MNCKHVIKVASTAALALMCGLGAVGCTQASGTPSVPDGAAAMVGTVPIDEDAVTSYVENFRDTQGLSGDDEWGAWLAERSMTPAAVREQAVSYYASQELVRQAAFENGVGAEPSEVDAQMQTLRGKYDSEEAWRAALAEGGITEDEQRSLTELMLLQQRLTERVVPYAEPTDEELLSSVQLYASACDGAKRSSHILFEADDEDAAREVLARIESGELAFEDAARDYSIDEASAARGGDVGWDKMSAFDEAYQASLDALEPGQTSDVVASSFGVHIILCTDLLQAPEEVGSLDQVSSGFVDTVRTLASVSAQKQAFSTWMQDYEAEAGFQIADMPEGLPYDIDMAPYLEAQSAQGQDEALESMPLAPDADPQEE